MWRKITQKPVLKGKEVQLKKELAISINSDKSIRDSIQKEISSLGNKLITLKKEITVSQEDAVISNSKSLEEQELLNKYTNDILEINSEFIDSVDNTQEHLEEKEISMEELPPQTGTDLTGNGL